MEKKHLDIILYGKVQGVGLRREIQHFAETLNIRGYVRNLRDKTVVMEVEGVSDKITSLIKWIELNPGFAKLDDIKVSEGEIKGYREFSIY